jgi:nucleotide-binding universal stress UspA family protein
MNDRPVVVPIDGSSLAERAVPYAVAFAKATGGKLLLVAVSEGVGARLDGGRRPGQEIEEHEQQHYRRYLESTAKNFAAKGLDIETELRIGTAADEILRVVEEREPRLLVLATHGRSGLGRWRYGSVANRLMREAHAPTLVVGPKVLNADPEAVAIKRILVPLDGSPLAEAALRPAAELANALGAELVLAQVLRWMSQTYVYDVPGVDVAGLDRDLADTAQAYLAKLRQGLATTHHVEATVVRGLPADCLSDLVESAAIQLVVMTSHCRSGVTRALLGSVAERMLQAAAPVLLVRPEAVAAMAEPARGRFCYNCGRGSPYVQVLPDERCVRCGIHLRTCANCVYYDQLACMLKRPELSDPVPGLNCAYFQFRETETPALRSLVVPAGPGRTD